MTRLLYGGTAADVYLLDDEEGDLHRGGGAEALFYNAKDGGEGYTDLLDMSGAAIDRMVTSTGADSWSAGQVPTFFGPDGVFEMWISVAGGPRVLMTPANLGSFLGPLRQQLEAHLAASNVNPHHDRWADMGDVDGASLDAAPAGSTVLKDASGLWVAGPAATGGGGVAGVTLDTDQTIAGRKTFNTGEGTKSRIVIEAAATGQVADLLVAWSGTDTGQGGQRQRTFYINEKGELRGIAAKASSTAFRLKGQPGQTANIMEVTDTANVPKAWFAPNYSFFAPNIGRSVVFTAKGNLANGVGVFAWTNDLGVPVTIRSVRTRVGTAPSGQAVVVDIKVNGVSIYATAANRPSIATGATTSGRNTGFSTIAVSDGATLTADIVQVGNPTVGADLTCQIEIW